MKKQVHTMITGFRDGFQSVFGARVFTKDFLPAVEASVAAGLNHFEAGGGARFQSLYFYCNEDAFDMMDQFRTAAGPEANLCCDGSVRPDISKRFGTARMLRSGRKRLADLVFFGWRRRWKALRSVLRI